jgi:tetratricopeptide (TPR) repeat protein
VQVGLAEAWWLLVRDQVAESDEGYIERQCAMSNFAKALSGRGEHAQAAQLQREVLDVQQRLLGADHPLTLRTRANLTASLRGQGKYAEAEQMLRDSQARVGGGELRCTLSAASNLASSLLRQGKYSEAEQIYREIHAARMRVLGPEDACTLNSAANLAASLSGQGKCTEAEHMQRDLLDVQRRVLGAEHPDTLVTTGGLAATLYRQGKYADAEQMQRELLHVQRRLHGPDHLNTLGTMVNLTASLNIQGKHAEAEKIQLDVQQRMLGVEHTEALRMQHGLPDVRKLELAAGQPNTAKNPGRHDPFSPNRFRMFLLPGVAAVVLLEMGVFGGSSPLLVAILAALAGLIVGATLFRSRP